MVAHFHNDQAAVSEFYSQVARSTRFIEYLKEVLSNEIEVNVFSEGYGETRALADGRAEMAHNLYKTLRDIEETSKHYKGKP